MVLLLRGRKSANEKEGETEWWGEFLPLGR
jgi:hypothetical protein